MVADTRDVLPKSKSAPEGLGLLPSAKQQQLPPPRDAAGLSVRDIVERVIEADFLEPLPRA